VLQEFVVRLRERGLAPVSCNTYVKGVNSFLAWLHAEGHLPAPLVLRPQRIEKRLVQTLTDEHLKRLVAYKPKTADQWRAYALACTLTDTGIRIEEALGLRQGDVDHDNLLLKVRAKAARNEWCPFRSSFVGCCSDGSR
jgi:site-specific recombinase XerD